MKRINYIIIFTSIVTMLLSACSTQKHIAQTVEPLAPTAPKIIISPPPTHAYSLPSYTPLKVVDTKEYYEAAYKELTAMLQGEQTPNFERAVFVSENPYHNNVYTYEQFQQTIDGHLAFIKRMIAVNNKSSTMNFDAHVGTNGKFKMADMRYLPKEKKELYQKALSNWAIYTYITDSIQVRFKIDSAEDFTSYHTPFTYATQDPFGRNDWTNTQVIGLLISDEQQGNCFAMTGFYKILADRLQSDARLCTAPQHIYIQHRDPKGDYYNVELATAGFPRDGTLQTLTHTTSDGIKSGIALRDYTTHQSIGLCLVNLAKSYEHSFDTKDTEFMLRCAETALQYDSLNLNALLLKQQVLDARVKDYAVQHKINSITALKQDANIKQTVADLETHIALLYRLGYRQMPLDMQQIIMSGNYPEIYADKNPSPFTSIQPKDKKEATYQALYGGLFQEVFEQQPTEEYGHFILDTKAKKLSKININTEDNFLIDPVAFAYDFGARMYDARLGKFLSTDRLESQFPHQSPYLFAGNTPIQAIDLNGDKVFIVSKNPAFIQRAFADLQKITNSKLILLKTGEVVTQKVFAQRELTNSLTKMPNMKPFYDLDIASVGSPNSKKDLKVGTKLVDDAIENQYSTFIQEQIPGKKGNTTTPRDFIGANAKGEFTEQGNGFGTGTGSDVDIYLDISPTGQEFRQKIVNADGTRGGVGQHIGQAHELGHGLRAMLGIALDETTYDYTNPDSTNPQKSTLTKEEIDVRKIYDNPIRKEQGEKPRAEPKKKN